MLEVPKQTWCCFSSSKQEHSAQVYAQTDVLSGLAEADENENGADNETEENNNEDNQNNNNISSYTYVILEESQTEMCPPYMHAVEAIVNKFKYHVEQYS